MFEPSLHQRVALITMIALTVVSGAVAGGPAMAQTGVSTDEGHLRTGATDDAVAAETNVSVTFLPEDGPIVVHNASGQVVRFRTNADPGTEMIVTVRSSTFNILMSEKATVQKNGTGVAVFDISNVPPGATFTVTTHADSDAETKGIVVQESASIHRDASFVPSDATSDYTVRGRVIDSFVGRVDVRLTSPDSSFSATETVAVEEDGTFAATFDLSSLPSDAEVSVTVGGIPRSVDEIFVAEASGSATVYAAVETPANVAIRYPRETFLVHPAPDQTVIGKTNLRPGTELTVKAINDEMNSPKAFTRSTNVTVREDGTFVADLNFTGIEPGTNFSVKVGPGLTYRDGRVVNESTSIPTVTTTASPTTIASSTTVDESGFSTDTPTTDESPDGHADGFGVPGFGVPVALLAILAGLVLALRR